ncbi:substrate-binding domain-containing protein [Nocardioides sp. Iso805N]|uniref:substrate-binding domain-containing protein n=1 Tax=Nocardioides sp. Iso805N TaxID=1283287 RepID=UPI0003806027|nr:substrate-binding domain-containing protein [Nocardioides sp. Iso805N]
MIRRLLSRRAPLVVRVVLVALISLGVMFRMVGPASASYAAIEGSGSTWAYGIVGQWVADVAAAGMQVTFTNNGSSQGRKDFANGVTDFGDSDIPYQGVDPTTGQADSSSRPYAYLPVVAGGTAFTYQIKVGGKLVKNLRLSGETLTKIFTNKITNWNDPEITKENGGKVFPSLPITPVVRSDGSGATAQFTLWMAKEYPSIWGPYNGGHVALTSLYPRSGRQVAANGDDGVMNTVKSAAGNGTIGYTEYSYPVNANYPVVYVENASGYYVQPTQYNVAVALTKAKINGCTTNGVCSPSGQSASTYLTQNLDDVYTFKDPRSYPVSSYSYMIIPTSSTDSRMTVAKRQTLADFLTYSLCTGQSKAGPFGYSPLPLNLVKAAFSQLEKLGPSADGGAVKGVNVKNPSDNLTSCDNPTFVKGNLSANHLAQIAPQPLACQKATATPCGDTTVAPGTPTGNGSQAPIAATTQSASGGGGGAAASAPHATNVDPATGEIAAGPDATGAVATTSGTTATANAVTLPANRSGDSKLFGAVSVIELAALIMVPGIYVAWRRRLKAGA